MFSIVPFRPLVRFVRSTLECATTRRSPAARHLHRETKRCRNADIEMKLVAGKNERVQRGVPEVVRQKMRVYSSKRGDKRDRSAISHSPIDVRSRPPSTRPTDPKTFVCSFVFPLPPAPPLIYLRRFISRRRSNKWYSSSIFSPFLSRSASSYSNPTTRYIDSRRKSKLKLPFTVGHGRGAGAAPANGSMYGLTH